jgi:hypothetical protein
MNAVTRKLIELIARAAVRQALQRARAADDARHNSSGPPPEAKKHPRG